MKFSKLLPALLVVSFLLVVTALVGHLFWRTLFPGLKYWHMLIFVSFIAIFCAWISFAHAIREKYLVVRIAEQIIAIIFILAVGFMLANTWRS